MNNNLIEFVTKDGSRRSIGPNDIKGLRFNFLGENNHIVIHEGTTFSDCSMSLIKDSYIEIGASQYLINKLYLFANQSRIEIGTDFSCWGVEIRCHEPKCLVTIGNDCMFSEEILIYPTD
ncbi:MAG: acetyltransferase, partial [Fusobacterium periodonticum]|nr:acetyltransferase [Fusobacterium periodonticum]